MVPVKKKLFCGIGPVLGEGGIPLMVTRSGAMAWGRRRAARMAPKGFWMPEVFEADGYFRVSFGGQPELREG